MSDNLKNEVKEAVKIIFQETEVAEMKKQTQKALEKSANAINELTESLEAKGEELVASKEQIVELESTVAGFDTTIKGMEKAKEEADSEKETWEAEKAELVKKAEDAEEALEGMKKDQVAIVRLSELTTEGVASKDEKTQLAKVRDMSDKEYAIYKEELVSVKEAIMAELDSKKVETANEGDVEGSDDAEETEDADVETKLSPGGAAMAALNMEMPNDDVMKKYSELGKAMAEKSTESRK